jgi:hypothetical protein
LGSGLAALPLAVNDAVVAEREKRLAVGELTLESQSVDPRL